MNIVSWLMLGIWHPPSSATMRSWEAIQWIAVIVEGVELDGTFGMRILDGGLYNSKTRT
jgi:hypothetical protein